MTQDEKLDLLLEKVGQIDNRLQNLEKGQQELKNDVRIIKETVAEKKKQ